MEEEKQEVENSELEKLIPQMNVNVPATQDQEENMIPDEMWLGMCSEIMNNLRQDRQDLDEVKNNFIEMVINEGDSTSASKEALVNLFKIKTDIADKMAKVLDLMTRVKLKEKDTFPKYLAAHQNNTINIADGSKRELIKQIQKIQKRKKEEQ
jgi:hypothetical protein